jgi:hypothetical protein
MGNLPSWVSWIMTIAVVISLGVAFPSVRPIARLLHYLLWPRPEVRPQSRGKAESGGEEWDAFGGAMFFIDYSMSAMELARALEDRGFDSVWAPEHSHIPLSRKTPFPGGGDLTKTILRCHGPVRGACRGQPGYQDHQARHGTCCW